VKLCDLCQCCYSPCHCLHFHADVLLQVPVPAPVPAPLKVPLTTPLSQLHSDGLYRFILVVTILKSDLFQHKSNVHLNAPSGQIATMISNCTPSPTPRPPLFLSAYLCHLLAWISLHGASIVCVDGRLLLGTAHRFYHHWFRQLGLSLYPEDLGILDWDCFGLCKSPICLCALF